MFEWFEGLLQDSQQQKKSTHHVPSIHEPDDFRKSMPWRLLRVVSEFVDGWQFLADLKKSVTIFGSARFDEQSPWYNEARKLGALLSDNGFDVITGGGPGIMEAAHRGVHDITNGDYKPKKGEAIGLNIQLPYEQHINPYAQSVKSFHYFFTRKVMLAYSSQAYVYFPGGFGTLDEFFEIINLIQSKRVDPNIAVVLVGKEYWETLLLWFDKYLYEAYGFIKEEDVFSYTLVDNAEEAYKVIKKKTKGLKSKRKF